MHSRQRLGATDERLSQYRNFVPPFEWSLCPGRRATSKRRGPRGRQGSISSRATCVLRLRQALPLKTLGSTLTPRPFVVQHVAPLFPRDADNGFPSDHTLLATFFAVCVFFYSRK